MLTRELGIADYEKGRVIPDRLTRRSHAHYVHYAERMLHIYKTGLGLTRRELHRAVQTVFAEETDCPTRRIDAFCKLLDDGQHIREGQPRPCRQIAACSLSPGGTAAPAGAQR